MKKYYLIVLSLVGAASLSCKSDPASPLAISPSFTIAGPQLGDEGVLYTFYAVVHGTASNAVHFEWIVDDTTFSVDNYRTFGHSFWSPGKHTVHLKTFDKKSGKSISEDSAQIAILKFGTKIIPDTVKGFVDAPIVFSILLPDQLPNHRYKFIWQFGNTSHQVTTSSDSTTYNFTHIGFYSIHFQLFDSTANELVSIADGIAIISPSPYDSISPSNATARPGQPIVFKAYHSLPLPTNRNLRFIWTFDSAIVAIRTNTDTVSAAFQYAGIYPIELRIVDDSSQVTIADLQATAIVHPDLSNYDPNILKSMKKAFFSFTGDNKYDQDACPNWLGNIWSMEIDTLHWNGNSFTGTLEDHRFFDSTFRGGPYIVYERRDSYDRSQKIAGVLTSNIEVIDSLLAQFHSTESHYSYDYNNPSGHGYQTDFDSKWNVGSARVSLDFFSPDTIRFVSMGSELKNDITVLNGYSSAGYTSIHGCYPTYVSTNWASSTIRPTLSVTFTK